MEKVILNGIEVNYDLSFKKNKNTYFYFKDDGYIKINASRYQTKKQIIDHMKNNAEAFLQKLNKASHRKRSVDKDTYLFFGEEYKVIKHESNNVELDHDNKCIYIHLDNIDHINTLMKLEKKIVIEELKLLHEKYIDNPYVDIRNITIKTRYTKTRFGSCNASKRNINMNTNLIHYDKKYLEYVFLHEISHLTHQNHSEKFYHLLSKLCPNYKQLRYELRHSYRR